MKEQLHKRIEEVAPRVPAAPMLQALDMSRATFYRHKPRSARSESGAHGGVASDIDPPSHSSLEDRVQGPGHSTSPASPSRVCRVPGRALLPQAYEAVRGVLYENRFVDETPYETYAALLDEGSYLCSVRTMYRILQVDAANKSRIRTRTHGDFQRPELVATAPNQVWSRDITKLKGPKPFCLFSLYVMLDLFSRYIVGWMVAERESQELATPFIEQTTAKHNIETGQLTIHADRGAAMTSKGVAQLLCDLGVEKTHSRPHVSNDNPFSESQFKTLKYRPAFPGRFACVQEARDFCAEFFDWYNNAHHHTSLGLLTPADVHYGRAAELVKKRQRVLDAAYTANPSRFVNGAPRHPQLPQAVWINPPAPTSKEPGETGEAAKRRSTYSKVSHSY